MLSLQTPIYFLSNILCTVPSITSAPVSISFFDENSRGLWLMPSLLGMKIIPAFILLDNGFASWLAPLIINSYFISEASQEALIASIISSDICAGSLSILFVMFVLKSRSAYSINELRMQVRLSLSSHLASTVNSTLHRVSLA